MERSPKTTDELSENQARQILRSNEVRMASQETPPVKLSLYSVFIHNDVFSKVYTDVYVCIISFLFNMHVMFDLLAEYVCMFNMYV